MKIVCVVENDIIKESDLQSEHGLSFWIETPNGLVLFDTGQTDSVFSHNLKTLGLPLQKVAAVALSHAHYDHTGGLETVLTAQKTCQSMRTRIYFDLVMLYKMESINLRG